MSERTALYRLFGAEDLLLYIGIASAIGRRWDQHAKAQSWWPEIARQEVTWLPRREEAEAAEVEAIKSEKPRYNVVHNGHRSVDAETGLPVIQPPQDDQYAISETRANLSELVTSVRLLRRCVFLTQRGKPRAALVPVEVGEAIKAAGGPDAALKLLGRSPTT